MRIIKSFLFFAVAMALVACGNEGAADKAEAAPTTSKAEVCTWAYDPGAKTSVQWKAYKTTKKVGVNGQFKKVTVTGGNASESITEMLSSVAFELPINSTITGDPSRDKKIKEFFFGEMANTDVITGSAKTVEGNQIEGTCSFDVTLNEVTKEIVLDYKVEDNFITLTGVMNIDDFSPEALIAMNKACEALHVGSDGVSKTWPDVNLTISTVLKKECK